MPKNPVISFFGENGSYENQLFLTQGKGRDNL